MYLGSGRCQWETWRARGEKSLTRGLGMQDQKAVGRRAPNGMSEWQLSTFKPDRLVVKYEYTLKKADVGAGPFKQYENANS